MQFTNANGNQSPNGVIMTRKVGGVTHTLTYDGENRLVKVMNGSTTIATFVYDGDGQRVKSTLNGVTTTFVGNYYEKTGTNITKYYYMGTARVAMRNTSVKYLFGDQLGSTSVTTNSSGVIGSQERYKPFGEMYYTSGTLPTRYTFTGQYSYTINTNEIGLMYYGARFYDPALGRFASADTIIPGAGNPQSWDRYSYGYNNPSRFTDPSGHSVCDMGEYADPECGNMNNQYQTILADKTKNNEIPKPIDHRLEEIDDDLPFDATLGGNNETSGSEMLLQNERPSLAALIVMGIPLTIAIILSEGVLVLAEVILVDATIAAPELALATVPLGLVLAGSGVALVDIEVAYWLYTYRVAVTPENEPVKFEILPPWGFGD